MAVTLQRAKLSVDLGNVVTNSITAVKAIRKSDQARKEAEFQRAIANGLSYEEQVAMRQAQLEEEKASSISDPDFVMTLETSIASTKKLGRFNKYRSRYAESLGELSAGKINEEEYLSTLKRNLEGVDDPELRLEIQGDITAAEGKAKQYKDVILSNQIKKAKYDGTRAALGEVIASVNTARAKALISDNQDEVTAYDETLSALNSQMSGVKIQDAITGFQVKSSTRGTNPKEKLDYINSEIQGADANTPIKIGDKSYTSAQQFWSSERDGFLAGSSQIFGNFFDELNTTTKNAINANAVKFGYPTQSVLDDTLRTFNELRSKPEMTPFMNRLDINQADVMSDAVDKLAKRVNSIGTNNLTFKEADIQLQNIATKYGVDVSGYRLQLDENLRNLARGNVITRDEAVKMAPDVNVELPKVEVTPTTPTAPSTVPAPVAPKPTLDVSTPPVQMDARTKAIQSLKDLGYSAPDETEIQAAMRNTAAPAAPSAVVPPAAATVTPAPTAAPVQSAYTGSSVVDYLKSKGQDTSTVSRAKLAVERGIVQSEDEYLKAAETGANASMNTKLLDALRKQQ